MATNTKLEQLSRTQHTSGTGIEITRTFYAEPYDSFDQVIRTLQGGVAKDDGEWKRIAPAVDTYIKSAYCNEAVVDFSHVDAMATADSLESAAAPPAPGRAAGNRPVLLKKLEDVPETTLVGSAGCKIIAKYRPLVTGWVPQSNDPDELLRIWDYMDPVFRPGIMQLPWPGGMFAKVDFPGPRGLDIWPVPADVATPIGVTVTDFSIRRMLVGLDNKTLQPSAEVANGVNKDVWPVPGSQPAAGLPKFEPRTLKFVGTDMFNRFDSTGRRWVELVHNFKWIQHITNRLFNSDGQRGSGWVTWNHVFVQPPLNPVGWYEVWLSTQFNLGAVAIGALLGGAEPVEGRMHKEVNFDILFDLNPK